MGVNMKTLEENPTNDTSHAWPRARQPALRPSRLHLVTVHDLRNLRDEFARGSAPTDLETKLRKLAAGDLAPYSIEQNCRPIIALLQAAYRGAFKEARPAVIARGLRGRA